MDMNKLIHFRTVVDSQSIRKASELLNISPAALSKSLRVFQDELEICLIEPYGRGIVITEKGHNLYRKSNRLIEELNHLKRNLNTPTLVDIRLGTYEVFSTHFIADFLNAEDVTNLTCVELAPGQIEQALLKREIDFGLNLVPFPHQDLEHIKIGSTYLKTFCKNKGDYVNKKQSELEYAVPITQLESNPTQSTVIDSWPDNIQRQVKHKFNMLETALQVCSNDHAVIYCPEISVRLYNKINKANRQLIEHSFQKANKLMPIYLVKRKETAENSFTKKLARYLRLQH